MSAILDFKIVAIPDIFLYFSASMSPGKLILESNYATNISIRAAILNSEMTAMQNPNFSHTFSLNLCILIILLVTSLPVSIWINNRFCY